MLEWKFLYIKYAFSVTLMFYLISCANKNNERVPSPVSLIIDTSQIPKDTVLLEKLKLDNGIYYLNNKSFSGYIKAQYNSNQTSSIGAYLNGKQEGVTTTFYPSGKMRDSRSYKNGMAFGRHYGYWENGHLKFEFIYVNDKREGINKQWYISGKPYAFLTFKDDKEHGMQRAWRENGKPYINYEAIDGNRYGLQKSALCYTLVDEKIKTR
jgi:antitoxin component YwqK of YwqJK toxin-antitoxin module